MTERYHNVRRRGYQAGIDDVTRTVRDFLAAGGQIAVQPFTGDLLILPRGQSTPWVAYSLAALAPYMSLETHLRRQPRPEDPETSVSETPASPAVRPEEPPEP